MIRYLTSAILAAGAALWVLALGGCSDLKDKEDLPDAIAPGVRVHDVGWNDTSAAGFHGKVLKSTQYRFNDCAPCHGRLNTGGTSGVSCFSCHASFPHDEEWTNPSALTFHGKFLAAQDWNNSECASCHGSSFTGGTSGVSCFTCHSSFPHSAGWIEPSANGFHGKFIRNASWDMRACRECHGEYYDGGRTGVSCRTCHNGTAGPENCATCHGNTNPAPPRDLSGNTATSAHGVGAHQRHFTGGGPHTNYALACSECHVVPPGVYSPGHVDSPVPAELTFSGRLFRADTSGVPGPVAYNFSDFKCSNTFCHGNWSLDSATARYPSGYAANRMIGANRQILWTGGANEIACGTCHATPPNGHVSAALSSCGSCHDQIVNAQGVIVDKVKHINGKINVFNQEWNF